MRRCVEMRCVEMRCVEMRCVEMRCANMGMGRKSRQPLALPGRRTPARVARSYWAHRDAER